MAFSQKAHESTNGNRMFLKVSYKLRRILGKGSEVLAEKIAKLDKGASEECVLQGKRMVKEGEGDMHRGRKCLYFQALAKFEKAVCKNPENSHAHALAGDLLFRMIEKYRPRRGELPYYERAMAHYGKAVSIVGGMPEGSGKNGMLADLLVMRGVRKINKADYDGAIKDCDKAAEIAGSLMATNGDKWSLIAIHYRIVAMEGYLNNQMSRDSAGNKALLCTWDDLEKYRNRLECESEAGLHAGSWHAAGLENWY
ncbi:MAG: hypothetical protein NTX79_07535 [Candidatus Micrarchaeota archaeon]|nr:hypothetical protein [Candidatus Micrarchaeota archaeon]